MRRTCLKHSLLEHSSNNNNRESHWIFYRLLWLLDSKPSDTPGWRLRNKQLEGTERYPHSQTGACGFIPWMIRLITSAKGAMGFFLFLFLITRDALHGKMGSIVHQNNVSISLAHKLILCHEISFEIETYSQITSTSAFSVMSFRVGGLCKSWCSCVILRKAWSQETRCLGMSVPDQKNPKPHFPCCL